MAVTNDQFFAPLIDDSGAFVSDDDTRQKLLERIIELFDNVSSEDRNILIKSKIRNLKFEKFNLAESLVHGDDYYQRFLATLDQQQLENVMAAISAPIMQGVQLHPQTRAAFQKVLDGKPIKTASNTVQELFDSLGKFFADSLKAAEDKQYEDENKIQGRNGRDFEARELALFGPCKDIFKNSLRLIPDSDQQRARKLIREKLIQTQIKLANLDKLSDKDLAEFLKQQEMLKLHKYLFSAADWLATRLENAGHTEQAANIRHKLQVAGYKPKPPKNGGKKSQSLSFWNKIDNLVRKELENLFRFTLKGIPTALYKPVLDIFNPTMPAAIKNQPNAPQLVPESTNEVNPNQAAQNLNDLSARVARLLNDMSKNANATQAEEALAPKLAPVQPKEQIKGLNFAYKPYVPVAPRRTTPLRPDPMHKKAKNNNRPRVG